MNPLLTTILAETPAERDRPLEELVATATAEELFSWCDELHAFTRDCSNLYQRVRAHLYLHEVLRVHWPARASGPPAGPLPRSAQHLFHERRYAEAAEVLRRALGDGPPDGTVVSALAEAHHRTAFQTLSDQVRRSVRASRGSAWMFRVGHPQEHPLRWRRELLERSGENQLYPTLLERTPVRADLSHSGWSDIFFLGMDHPEGARVVDLSVDLAVHGRDEAIAPPIEAWVRVLPEALVRLTSVDLGETKDVTTLEEMYRFGNDHLALLKAGVVASGVIPPSLEGTPHSLQELLRLSIGPGLGFELATYVRDIPKGSRLAVSTNLLASIVAVLLRASGQARSLEGSLDEEERRLVAGRAILGEWLGGSGGGWQDSGGVWPSIKCIEGVRATESDPEFGISRGCLLPRHRLLGAGDLHPAMPERLAASLILFHGGMAQNVGPILEMVTERYLLRTHDAWEARRELGTYFDAILAALRDGDVRALAAATDASWRGPLRTILPWIASRYVDRLLERLAERLGPEFWGFQMLGGMAGGGMGIYVAPERREEALAELATIALEEKRAHERSLPFAMDPLIYDFRLNPHGTRAELRRGVDAVFPWRYQALQLPRLARSERAAVAPLRRAEMLLATAGADGHAEAPRLLAAVTASLFGDERTRVDVDREEWRLETRELLEKGGFDAAQHEQIRRDLREGRIGLVRNRLPAELRIESSAPEDLLPWDPAHAARGSEALRAGRVAVLTLAAGVGSRWTGGAGVVKAVSPFARREGRWRSFLEVHLEKTRRIARAHGVRIPHLVATSFLTHTAISEHLAGFADDPEVDLRLSPGRSISRRFVPMARDLAAHWERTLEQRLDPEKEKVRETGRRALLDWARARGEGSDYDENLPAQRLAPTGHAYEVPALLKNGVLVQLLRDHPGLDTLLVHNVDTLGASPDPIAFGAHRASGAALGFEVVPRRSEDRGGGLARVAGRPRLVEALALPEEELELELPWYSSMTTWVDIDAFLALFGLERSTLAAVPPEEMETRVRNLLARLPTYVAIKEVKLRWGRAQEDIYPVAQWERLWGDFSALPEVRSAFLAVPRARGQQLKDPALLDLYARDGTL